MKRFTYVLGILIVLVFPVITMASVGTAENCKANQSLPDPVCSPGDVLTTNIKTICKVGYTKTVRNVSVSTRKKVFKEYGIPYASSSDYEVDHIISLELGGSNDIKNLFPESYLIKDGAKDKRQIRKLLT